MVELLDCINLVNFVDSFDYSACGAYTSDRLRETRKVADLAEILQSPFAQDWTDPSCVSFGGTSWNGTKYEVCVVFKEQLLPGGNEVHAARFGKSTLTSSA